MSNPSKAKGDRAEREAVAELVSLAPDLVSVHNPQRKLGAGRAEDTGDLWVFHDVAIQVRSYDTSRLGIAIRSAAVDAVVQATNAGVPYALGMVPIPGSGKGTVRWLACGLDWPDSGPTADVRTDGPLVDLRDGPCRQPVEFRQVGRAITWLRDDDGPTATRHAPGKLGSRVYLSSPARGQRATLVAGECWSLRSKPGSPHSGVPGAGDPRTHRPRRPDRAGRTSAEACRSAGADPRCSPHGYGWPAA